MTSSPTSIRAARARRLIANELGIWRSLFFMVVRRVHCSGARAARRPARRRAANRPALSGSSRPVRCNEDLHRARVA